METIGDLGRTVAKELEVLHKALYPDRGLELVFAGGNAGVALAGLCVKKGLVEASENIRKGLEALQAKDREAIARLTRAVNDLRTDVAAVGGRV